MWYVNSLWEIHNTIFNAKSTCQHNEQRLPLHPRFEARKSIPKRQENLQNNGISPAEDKSRQWRYGKPSGTVL